MIITLILIGISLAMDTFSISLSLGVYNKINNKIILYIFIVALLHFALPIIGYFMGYKINNYLNINGNLLLGLILIFIAIEMILELIKKEDNKQIINTLNIILLSISVSLDSFSSGIGLPSITNNYLLSSTIFSVFAIIFSIIGYLIGIITKKKLGNIANIIAILILISISIYNLLLV